MTTKFGTLARAIKPHTPRKLSKPHVCLRTNGTWEVYTLWDIKEDLTGGKYPRLARNTIRNYNLLQRAARKQLGLGYRTTWDVYFEFPRGTLLVIKSIWSPKP